MSLSPLSVVVENQFDTTRGRGPTVSNEDVCIVIPAYNEATTIGGVVTELLGQFEHVLVVDDGSADDTASLARAAGAAVARHPINLGAGAALETGLAWVAAHPEFDWVVTFDADGQHLVSDAVRMLARARVTNVDVVLASRFTGSTIDMPTARRVLLRGAVAFTRLTTHLNVTDAHNGLRVINTRALPDLHLTQCGMAHASELTSAISAAGLTYCEVSTTVRYSEYSQAKGQRNLNAVNVLFDLAAARMRFTA
jgi:glycosyltransferase involved in cell wall biosynthesis